MTFAAVSTPIDITATTVTVVPHAVGNFFLCEIVAESSTVYATALSSSNITWSVLVPHTLAPGSSYYVTMFIGQVTSTSSATVTVTFSGTAPTVRGNAMEFSTTAGYSELVLDSYAMTASAATTAYPTLTPVRNGELYFGYAYNTASAVAGSTAGFTYNVDSNSNGACWNLSASTSAQTPTWSDSSIRDGMAITLYEAWPGVSTYNFCSNPSFETDLTGVSALSGAAVVQNTGLGFTGTCSLQVNTPGAVTGEGCVLPPGTVLGSATGAVSFYLQGNDVNSAGVLNVYAIDTTTSTTLGTTEVLFVPQQSWQRVAITGLSLVAGHVIQVYVETANSPQATAFNIDAVQYEPSLPGNVGGVLPTPYIDGDQPFGFWVGTAEESASYKLYQNQLSSFGDIRTSGTAGPLLATQVISGHLTNLGTQPTLVFTDPASGPTTISGNIDLSGKPFTGLDNKILVGGGSMTQTGMTVLLMLAGLDDFAIFSAGDVDPAISLIGYNNAGISTGTNTSGSAGWTRPYATFSAPQVFTGSTSKNIWNQAAFFSVGYEIGSLAAGVVQNLTHVQAELVPSIGAAITPTTYVRPRALTASLAPTEMNYVTNPNFGTSTSGWTALTGTTMTQEANPTGGTPVGISGYVANMTGTVTQIGAYIPVPDLIVGETYTASVWVYDVAAASPMVIAINPTAAFTYYAGTSVTLTAATWTQVDVQFVAPASTVNLAVFSNVAGSTQYYMSWVMLNPGGLQTYNDPTTNSLWTWESTANLSRSYFYSRGNVAYGAVQQILSSHLPYGIHAYDPVYYSPVTQYN